MTDLPGCPRPKLAAVIIVAGGDDPRRFRWLDICLRRIADHTLYPNYRVYVKNYDLGNVLVEEMTERWDHCTRIDHDPGVAVQNAHADGLQHAYERARDDGAKYIVTLDSDSMPIRHGWLSDLVEALDGGAALAGCWHEALPDYIAPYVHPCGLATTVAFIESNQLRFDQVMSSAHENHDTLSHLTRAAEAAGLPVHKLVRSNKNALHYVIATIYGDTIFHHGAGSRRFSPLPRGDGVDAIRDRRIADLAALMMFHHELEYFDWLGGQSNANRLFVVLGMHRSGTSCLTACLEQCGVSLGDVERTSFSQPRGNLEQDRVKHLNDQMLRDASSSWRTPPSQRLSPDHFDVDAMTTIVAELSSTSPSAMKDPRSLFTIDAWLGVAANATMIGTFRHPDSVAQSLYERDGMPRAEALELWHRYNAELVDLHQKHGFPLIEFDVSDPSAYSRTIVWLAAEFGLRPRLRDITDVVVAGSSRAHVAAGSPVPPECQEIYAYLRDNRYSAPGESSPFAALLVEWGAVINSEVKPSVFQDFELWAWSVGRRVPRWLRAGSRSRSGALLVDFVPAENLLRAVDPPRSNRHVCRLSITDPTGPGGSATVRVLSLPA